MSERKCEVMDCDRVHNANGFCRVHNYRMKHHGSTELIPTRVCDIDGCTLKHMALGFCETHYYRLRTYGDPMKISPRAMEPEQRLLFYVTKTETCWLWHGTTNHKGYGQARWKAFPTPLIHRIAYLMWVGPIPDGFEIDHLCGVRNCVRPDHLEAVTVQENRRRARHF